ncbi:MAG: phenylacetate-CoA oxygenase subunit PaaI [Candidatus Eremiobacteraeota bacterium]|nr:phenylacetate-CoA oxygenase subunit PaaI [Candidatus Eremiobacteraeota bacterium]
MARIKTFDDWVEVCRAWQRDIDVDPEIFNRVLGGYTLEAKYGDLHSDEIEFGEFAGTRKWEKVLQIPDQRMRDAVLNMIIYQGDTEFASNEQQRLLLGTAPSDYDLHSIARVFIEETRHGYQMCHLLIGHFGNDGRIEAEKMLERRADQGTRLLNAFNNPVKHWLDLYAYQNYMDRDGKFQLQMLSHSGFAPLSRSMGPMLREESFHLGAGVTGLKRVARANVVPVRIQQKYHNKWLSGSLDLFGNDHSSSATWSYIWGIKGRPAEDTEETPADRERLNEHARTAYYREVSKIIGQINAIIPGEEKLYVPDIRFNRHIGEYAGKPYSVDGRLLDSDQYEEHLRDVLPTEEDENLVMEFMKRSDWVAPKAA